MKYLVELDESEIDTLVAALDVEILNPATYLFQDIERYKVLQEKLEKAKNG